MQQKTNVPGVISLNLSIISIMFSPCACAGLLLAITALIFGIIGVTRKNRLIGTAISGIIMSIVGGTLSVIVLIFQETLMQALQSIA